VNCGSKLLPIDPAMAEPDIWADVGRWFDRDWYLLRNPDVRQVGIDPLAHYRRYGETEGRFPSPWFNPNWYRVAYDIPAEQSPLEHFLLWRNTGQFLPCAALYLVPHLPPWRDAGANGADPFDQYLTETIVPQHELLPDLTEIQSSGLIDADYYRINPIGPYEDELDPALHYCRIGWRSGLRPSTAFEPDWYAETNPIITRLRINPLTHYILQGEPANRRPVPWFDPAWYRSAYQVPQYQLALAHYLQHRHARAVSPDPLFNVDRYVARYGASIPREIDPFSHYLVHGALRDIDPSPQFAARIWRHRHMAPLAAVGQSELPVSARNPLVHHLQLRYRTRRQSG
jgi:hypothetical protein